MRVTHVWSDEGSRRLVARVVIKSVRKAAWLVWLRWNGDDRLDEAEGFSRKSNGTDGAKDEDSKSQRLVAKIRKKNGTWTFEGEAKNLL